MLAMSGGGDGWVCCSAAVTQQLCCQGFKDMLLLCVMHFSLFVRWLLVIWRKIAVLWLGIALSFFVLHCCALCQQIPAAYLIVTKRS
jgi:hypothetical protein